MKCAQCRTSISDGSSHLTLSKTTAGQGWTDDKHYCNKACLKKALNKKPEPMNIHEWEI